MAGVATEESGAVRLFEGVSTGQLLPQQQGCQSVEALAEWRSSEQVENGIPSTSPPYWDSDDDNVGGPKPVELYGKYTWKIDKFSQINKRELRSNAFEVGGYKWYILIYPQGCDVCNHLSLFLCVANHDKLLPGWSHFAQFTIAVVNKDPKKSKYSDTLHRFWKKEHDWGWKKFMELSKVLDGFVDADTLIIKAQVQVIRERADRPFRCLDCQYRRELVRVYLTNVEQICRRFVEERRGKLLKLLEDKARWSSFCAFWLGMDQSSKRRMSREKTESILKVVVKHFFVEKEVTSTLVMDSLYSGLKALEGQIKGKKSKGKYLAAEELPVPIVCIEKDSFFLVDDVLLLLERAAVEPLPPKDEKGPQNRTKEGAAGEEFNKDSIERDERQLTELGRRTIEIFVLAHIFSKIEVAYQEAVSLKRQEELIREEEAAWLAETELKGKRGAMDKEKKSKKKQGKQKRNSRKGKDKGRDDKPNNILEAKIEQDNPTFEKEDFLAVVPEMILENFDAAEDVSDVSDSLDHIPEIPPPDSEDRDMSPVNWDTDTSEVQLPTGASSSGTNGLSGVQYGIEGRNSSVVDDSSSTCSSDSVPSVVISVHRKGNSRYHQNPKSPSRGRSYRSKMTSDSASRVSEERTHPSEAVRDAGHPNDASQRSNIVESLSQATIHSLQDRVVSKTKRHVVKEEETGSLHRNLSVKDDVDGVISGDRAAGLMSPPWSPSKIIPSIAPKLESNIDAVGDLVMVWKPSSDSPKQPDRPRRLVNSPENAATLKPDTQKVTTPKPAEKPSGHQIPIVNEKHTTQHVSVTTDKSSMSSILALSRPLSAPLNPGPRPAISIVSMVQTAPILARSVSATGRLGPESTASATSSYTPQSYLNAMIGSSVTGSLSAYSQNHSASSVANASQSYPESSALVSMPSFSPHCSDRKDPSSIHPSFSFGMVNCHDAVQNVPLWMECPQRNISRNLPGDHLSPIINDMQSFDLYNPVHVRSQDRHSLDFSACTSGRQSHVLADEFPHLDIINDLLDDEHGTAKVARANAGYQSFSNGPQHLNRQFSFSSDLCMTNGLGQSTNSCRFERTQSYHDDGFQYGYGASRSSYETLRDMIPQASPRQYVDGQIDGLRPDQWQTGVTDMPFLSIRSMDNGGYPYHIPEFSNLTVGVNGYTVFRPSNGL